MPHIIIEYTAGLDQDHDFQALCEDIYQALAAHPAVPDPTTLKIRALPCPYWRNGREGQSFVHADLKLLAGRDAKTKAELADLMLAAMAARLKTVGCLSVDVIELSATYTKREL
jgi:5-carboxymethyl-2-hydroxymuconate isomerase